MPISTSRLSLFSWLISCLISTVATAAEPLVLTPDRPVLDNGGKPGMAEFQVDLTPADKALLSGSGVIEVFVGQNPLALPPYPTELLGNGKVLIAYNGQTTTPATVRFRKASWMPNPANELSETSFSCTVTTAPDSPVGERTATAWGVSRGSHYATVKSYMQKHRDLNSWIGLFLDVDANLDVLAWYQVPESAFVAWAPAADGPATIAHGYQLGYQPQAYAAFGGGSVWSWPGLYSGQAWGWNSRAEMLALQLDYERDVMPVNSNVSFSLRNRVPVSYFLSHLSATPGDSGQKDYAIAASWNREQGIQRLNDLGLPATALMASLLADYRLNDFCSVAPHALEAAARTYSEPTWRQEQPLALVVFNREMLFDGAFSEADIIGTLAKTHRLVVCQAYDAESFLAVADKAYRRNGPFDVVALCGHGTEAQASVFDIANTNAFADLAPMLTPGATVLLASCLGAHFNPYFVQARVDGGHSTIHVAAAMQAALPSARVVAASDLVWKAMLCYDAAATKPEERYRVAFQGAHVCGDIPGQAPHGTPRDWLRREFGLTTDWAALESADADGDGKANWLEYLAGTNPRSTEDVFKITAALNPKGQTVLQWPGTCRNEHAIPFKVFRRYGQGEWVAVAASLRRSVSGINTWTDPDIAGGPVSYRIAALSGATMVELGTVSAPAITSTAPTTAAVGIVYTYVITTTGTPTPTLVVSGKPSWLTLTGSTLSGTPTAAGTTGPITITASNGVIPNATQTFSIVVSAASVAPAITSTAPTTAAVGTAYTYAITTTGTPTPTLAVSGKPSWLTLTGSTLSGTPTAVGTTGPITITASNGVIPNAIQTFSIVVSAATVAPAITSTAPTTATVGTAYTYAITTTGTPTPTLAVSGNPSWLTLTGSTLSGTPTAAGTAGPVTITASNGVTPNATQTFSITVSAAPAITSTAPTTATVGTAYTYTITTTGSPVPTLSVSGNPSWLTLTGSTLSGTPTAAGTAGPITITASNGVTPNATQTFSLTISAASAAPKITSTAPTTATVGTAYTYAITTTGTPTPTLAVSGNPTWLTLTGSTLSGTPPAAGTAGPITITASNGVTPNATQTFSIVMTPAGAGSPVITSQPIDQTVTVGETASFTVTASGTPAPTFQWQRSNDGATWNPITGATVSAYTTVATVIGDSGAKFRCVATNSVGSATSNAATLTVTAANDGGGGDGGGGGGGGQRGCGVGGGLALIGLALFLINRDRRRRSGS